MVTWIIIAIAFSILLHSIYHSYRRAKYESDITSYLEECRRRRIDALYGRLSIADDRDAVYQVVENEDEKPNGEF